MLKWTDELNDGLEIQGLVAVEIVFQTTYTEGEVLNDIVLNTHRIIVREGAHIQGIAIRNRCEKAR